MQSDEVLIFRDTHIHRNKFLNFTILGASFKHSSFPCVIFWNSQCQLNLLFVLNWTKDKSQALHELCQHSIHNSRQMNNHFQTAWKKTTQDAINKYIVIN